MKRHPLIAALCALSALVCSLDSFAIAPPYVSDKDLSAYPVIVVAQWEKAPFTSNNRYREDEDLGKVVTKSEAYTTLNVVRVIKGDVKPGEHKLMVGWGIGWAKDGKWVNSASSTELMGDVHDITEPCIWFLTKETSWDEKDKAEYLSVSNYRAIQPLSLEEYFGALSSRQPDKQVPKLLASRDAEVVTRALRYVCGGSWPWPHDSDFDRRYQSPEKQAKILRGEADNVAKVIERRELKNLRSLAVAVYAELKGKRCVDYVRGLLADDDADVRAMAVSVLARNKDGKSVDGMIQAVGGITNGWMSCRVIESIQGWGDDRLVPALISFLENGDSAGFAGDDLFIPSIKARKALSEITGHVFPFSVKSSLEAWKKAEVIDDLTKRKKLLSSLIPCDAIPLKAEVVGTNNKASLRLTNTSKQIVTITKQPAYGHQCSPGASFGYGFDPNAEVKGKKDFVALDPGKSIELKVKLRDRFLLADPSTREMTVVFDNNGSAFGVNAWIGNLKVTFGEEWKEKREIKNVVEKWPNGNLKAVGQTINGERFGEWNFFNEEGDRTDIIPYASNHGSAKCNTEHPSNKGAGIPKEEAE